MANVQYTSYYIGDNDRGYTSYLDSFIPLLIAKNTNGRMYALAPTGQGITTKSFQYTDGSTKYITSYIPMSVIRHEDPILVTQFIQMHYNIKTTDEDLRTIRTYISNCMKKITPKKDSYRYEEENMARRVYDKYAKYHVPDSRSAAYINDNHFSCDVNKAYHEKYDKYQKYRN